MKILIDIGHPAHVHLFKNLAWDLINKGHSIFFTCREKEFEIFLLQKYGFSFRSFGRKYSSKIGKILGLFEFDIKEIAQSLLFKPDLFLSAGSFYASHSAFVFRKPHISLEDTGNWEQVRLYLPFSKAVLTSNVFPHDYGNKQIRYLGHHEISYLHPNRFKANEHFKERINLTRKKKYVLIRFVSWKASHDFGQKGLSNEGKIKLISLLSKKYKVFISSESPLPQELENYRVTFKPNEIHDALYFAELLISEGTTMAMEAAVLGTPSFYINTLQYNNVQDMAKYGLVFNFTNEDTLFSQVQKFINGSISKEKFKKYQKRMLSEKIDVTAFLVWFVENYPDSFNIMKQNPAYQKRFK